jgi:IclR family acetate operon transcriptional repressor
VSAPKLRRPDGDLVQSLMRAIELLEILAEKSCRLKELSRRSGLAPSTTHRLLTTLEQKRFVRFDREQNVWMVGSHCFSVGAGFLRGQDFMVEAAARIDSLSNQIGATVNIGVPHGDGLLLVKQAHGSQISPAQPPGTNFPLHATAMGKMLLAGSKDDSHIRGYLEGSLKRLTERTICDPSALVRELETIKAEGVAVDCEESMSGRSCIAAPIRNELGECVAAISVTATRSQLSGPALVNLSQLVATAAAEVTRASGGFVRR